MPKSDPVDGGHTGNAETRAYFGSRAGKAPFGRAAGYKQQPDLGRRYAGGFEAIARREDAQSSHGFAGRSEPAFTDSGGFQDPRRIGIHAGRQIPAGNNPGRHVETERAQP
jgi:hypothetical protein